MTKRIKKIIACAAIAGLLALVTESSGAVKWPMATKGIKIFSLPEDQVVPTNGIARFTVVAEPLPLTFQWLKNGTKIPGATNASYSIPYPQPSDVGFYSVLVTKKSGTLAVKGVESDAPGARLFVIIGTNTMVSGPFAPGSGTKSCVGSYTGRVTFKNASNSTWWVPPAGSTNCTITDTSSSSYVPPYVPVVQANDDTSLAIWCATNLVTFPVTAGHKYQFTTYIKTPPPPNSGDPLTLDIHWAP